MTTSPGCNHKPRSLRDPVNDQVVVEAVSVPAQSGCRYMDPFGRELREILSEEPADDPGCLAGQSFQLIVLRPSSDRYAARYPVALVHGVCILQPPITDLEPPILIPREPIKTTFCSVAHVPRPSREELRVEAVP